MTSRLGTGKPLTFLILYSVRPPGYQDPNRTHPNITSAPHIMTTYVKKDPSLRKTHITKDPPCVTKDILCYEMLYMSKWCMLPSDRRFEMMYVTKQRTFWNSLHNGGGVGCRGMSCYGTFYHIMYPHTMFQAVWPYVAAPKKCFPQLPASLRTFSDTFLGTYSLFFLVSPYYNIMLFQLLCTNQILYQHTLTLFLSSPERSLFKDQSWSACPT